MLLPLDQMSESFEINMSQPNEPTMDSSDGNTSSYDTTPVVLEIWIRIITDITEIIPMS